MKEKAGIVTNSIIRGGDEHPLFDEDSIRTARKLLAIPLDVAVNFRKEFQTQANSKDKTLSSNNKICIMLTIAAYCTSEHTGVDVNACHTQDGATRTYISLPKWQTLQNLRRRCAENWRKIRPHRSN